MGRLRRKMRKGSSMTVELSDTGEKMVIEVVRVGERTCDVFLECPESVKAYPTPKNDEGVKR